MATAGGLYAIIAIIFGIGTGMIGRSKGSSFWLWFVVGAVIPVFGAIAALLSRSEHIEPERRCPQCGAVHKLHVQVCTKCGLDLELPPVEDVRPGPAYR
jgi:hypothetical protein